MPLFSFFVGLSLLVQNAVPAPSPARARSLQPLPLSSSDRWIVDANGNHVPFVGVNWPGAADAMIPEGLQYQSVQNIVQKIVSTGFNAVRLTFAIEMVDDIIDNGGDVTLKNTLTKALGDANGLKVLGQILTSNPQFTESTTRLQVFDAVAAEMGTQGVYLHLDNHVSKAMWCCSLSDGNSWFGDTYFDTDKWIRGLSYMASHGKSQWPTFTSVGLRNELRLSTTGASTLESYGWNSWKKYMTAAASAVYAANPSLLIFFSGLESDFNIEPIVGGSTAIEPSFSFKVTDYEWAHKFVLEMHEYDENISSSCTVYKLALLSFGFDATTKNGGNRAPLVITEFGYDQTDSNGAYKGDYAQCLLGYMVERELGWMLWNVAGSYYIREGAQDTDESYGIFDHQWNGYRGTDSLAELQTRIQQTYAAYGQ